MVSQKLRKALSPVLFPVSMVFGLVTTVRNKLFDWQVLKSRFFDIPVISVGNITIGGTGKTPHVEYLLNLLGERFTTAVLSRGYKRKTRGYILANNGVSAEHIGDEPYQMYRKFKSVQFAVDEKRVHGIECLKNDRANLQCVILDDAFQHRYVIPGVSIVLIDYHRPLKDDYLIPMGDMRERKHGIHRAHIVVVTKVPHEVKPIEKRLWIKDLNLYPYQYLFFTGFEYGNLKPVLKKKQHELKLDALESETTDILLVTGVANPQPLYDELVNHAATVKLLQYPDHHEYSSDDIAHISRAYQELSAAKTYIVTTEKDAVKLENLSFPKDLAQKLYYLPIQVSFLDDTKEEFDNLILNYVAEDKEINRLHR